MIRVAPQNAAPSLMPDMTALLDVISLMLIFLILIVQPVNQILEIDLPQSVEAETAEMVSEDSLLVMTPDQWRYNDKLFQSWEAVAAVLTQQLQSSNEQRLRIQADKSVPLQQFVQILEFAQSQRITIAELEVANTHKPIENR